MNIEELNLDVRLYNTVKRAGISTTEELLGKLYLHDAIEKFGARNIISIEKALKKAGITQYARGDYITADDVLPETLTWEQLHGMVGQLAALDISSESSTAYRVVWLYSFNGDDTRIIFQQDGNGYGNCNNNGKFYALKGAALPADSERQQAEALHQQILTFGEMVVKSLWGMCVSIKQMRDSKLYKALGYTTFEAYTEEKLGMKRRQAYDYIAIADNLSEDFVRSSAQIGMKKLYLLSKVTEEQREQITETVNIETTTVKALQEQIKAMQAEADKKTKMLEQAKAEMQESWDEISQREEEISELKSSLYEKNEQISEMQAQIDDLESRPIEVTGVLEPSHEVQNLMDAMKKMNREFDESNAKMQDDHIRHVQQIHREHREQMAAMQAEYEAKLQQAGGEPDSSAVFEAYFSAAEDAILRAVDYLKGIQDSGCEEKFRNLLLEYAQEEWKA